MKIEYKSRRGKSKEQHGTNSFDEFKTRRPYNLIDKTQIIQPELKKVFILYFISLKYIIYYYYNNKREKQC